MSIVDRRRVELRSADGPPCADTPTFDVLESRETDVGGLPVRRALPKRQRRLIGAWCFVDHFGPAEIADRPGMQLGPHPHIGLQTVTWLVDGDVVHRDSLGSEQLIRPGQLNLMTAGHGIAHAEESPRPHSRELHGAQLWVALPDATRHQAPAFDHHTDLPRIEPDHLIVTVLVGQVLNARSPARSDTELLGLELVATGGGGQIPLEPAFEHGVVVLDGELTVEGRSVTPGRLVYLGRGRDSLDVGAARPARALLLGGAPFGEDVFMWWNFVARSADEVRDATVAWDRSSSRFGTVQSDLDRMPAPPPPATTTR